jgi:hypothetical protein
LMVTSEWRKQTSFVKILAFPGCDVGHYHRRCHPIGHDKQHRQNMRRGFVNPSHQAEDKIGDERNVRPPAGRAGRQITAAHRHEPGSRLSFRSLSFSNHINNYKRQAASCLQAAAGNSLAL